MNADIRLVGSLAWASMGIFGLAVVVGAPSAAGQETTPDAGAGDQPDAADMDFDGVPGSLDNCPVHPNPDQGDVDHDGIGDACDAPENDECASATVLDAPPLTLTQPAHYASGWAANDPVCYANDHTVWFRYTPTTTEHVTVDASTSGYLPFLSVFGGTCDALAPTDVTCTALGASFVAVAGHTYFIVVGAYTEAGSLVLDVKTEPMGVADLDVEISGYTDFTVDNEAYYQVQVGNLGPDAATGVTLTTRISGGATLLDSIACSFPFGCSPCRESGDLVTCDLGVVLPGMAQAFLQLHERMPAVPGSVTHEATVESDRDEVPENDTATLTTKVVLGADIVGVFEVPRTRNGLATLLVRNDGPETAAGVWASIGVWHATPIQVHSTRGTCPYPGVGYCLLGDLAPGDTAVVTLRSIAEAGGGTVFYSVRAGSQTPDPNLGNNWFLGGTQPVAGAATGGFRAAYEYQGWMLAGPCAPDEVQLFGTVDYRWAWTITPSGNGHIDYVADPADLSGIGMSGETYHADGSVRAQMSFDGVPFGGVLRARYELVGDLSGTRVVATDFVTVSVGPERVPFVFRDGPFVDCDP